MDFTESISQLKAFTTAIHLLSQDEWQDFEQIWQPVEAKRKTLLTAAGHTEKHLYFVLEGVQRAWFQGDDGEEATIIFTYPFSFSGVADSFLLQQPSRYHFETISNDPHFQAINGNIQIGKLAYFLLDRYFKQADV